MDDTSITFLGCGNSHSSELGNSCAVFQVNNKHLVIDFGFSAYHAYKQKYARYPDAIFITHAHFDHIGGLENLFFDAFFSHSGKIKLYVPYTLIGILHQKMASVSHMIAEGGVLFWDCFQLIPVSDSFWFESRLFKVFENRHHQPGFSFGLSLPGVFLYSGDTKPIPEIINHLASQGEVIFHDLSLSAQPSHTYISEIKQYTENVLSRCYFYHLGSKRDQEYCEAQGLNIVRAGDTFVLGKLSIKKAS